MANPNTSEEGLVTTTYATLVKPGKRSLDAPAIALDGPGTSSVDTHEVHAGHDYVLNWSAKVRAVHNMIQMEQVKGQQLAPMTVKEQHCKAAKIENIMQK